MREVSIINTGQLLEELNKLPNHFVYRGHADADWQLESSLERIIGESWSGEAARKFEDHSLDRFRSKFHLYDRENIRPESKLAWLCIMQHYGVPTRLLDFSESPYVALYFALEAYDPRMKRDIAVFAIDYTAIMERSIQYIADKDAGFKESRRSVHENQDKLFDVVVDEQAYDVAWVAEPRQFNARLDRQAGSFLLSGNPARRIKEILELPTYHGVQVLKYQISGELYASIFALLRKMNVTSKSLYGDLEGLARSIKMELQVYSI